MKTVIIGSGLAGWTVARELRKQCTDNASHSITLLCADDGHFYSKPMLSNAFAAGKTAGQLIVTPAEKLLAQLAVNLLTNVTVSSIERHTKQIHHSAGTTPYDQLVLAIGASPIRLNNQSSSGKLPLSVNHINDYAAFRERLLNGSKIGILGAGLIGCEFANDLIKGGHSVIVYDIAPLPLGRLLPTPAGQYVKNALGKAGVEWRLGSTASPPSDVDCILSAVGLQPNTALASAAGLIVGRGIRVNQLGQTNDPSIYALGDCAEYGADEYAGLVLPYILPIMQAAKAIALSLAGTPTRIHFPAMPIVVKTPSCPLIVAPPAMGAQGQWEHEYTPEGMRSLYKSSAGHLLGYALIGDATKERQTYAPQLPIVWA